MTLVPFTARRRGGAQLTPASLVRWDPYREMQDINSRFDQLIRTFFGDSSPSTSAGNWNQMAPPVDVEETENSYLVELDLPNVDPQDVTIEMRGEEIQVSGRYQDREHTGAVRRQNRPTGDFEFLIDLPSDIDPNQVDASYDNGVLTISVAKKRDLQPRRIEIHAGNGRQRLGQGDQSAAQDQADQAQARADQAQTKADQTRAQASQAQARAEETPTPAHQADAQQAQGRADQAQAQAEQAKADAQQAQAQADDQAKADADQGQQPGRVKAGQTQQSMS
jgi:HSP20 family protein